MRSVTKWIVALALAALACGTAKKEEEKTRFILVAHYGYIEILRQHVKVHAKALALERVSGGRYPATHPPPPDVEDIILRKDIDGAPFIIAYREACLRCAPADRCEERIDRIRQDPFGERKTSACR